MNSIFTLIIEIGVGVIIIGLVGYIFNREKSAMMTKEEHAKLCQNNTKELMKDVKGMLTERMDDLKEFMSKDIKIAILEEMRNGRK